MTTFFHYLCKSIATAVLLCLCVPALQAQRVVAQLDVDKRTPKPDFYEYSPIDKGVVTFGATKLASTRTLGLVKYGANLQPAWTRTVLEQNGRNSVDFMTVLGQFTYVFVSESFPREKVIKTYYYKYDLNGVPIAEAEPMAVYPIGDVEAKVELKYVHSPNKRRMMCYRVLDNGKEAEKMLYYLFDDEGNYTGNGEMELKYPDDKFKIRSIKVSNQGNIYLLGKLYETSHIREADDVRFLLYKYYTDTERGGEARLSMGDVFVNDMAFGIDREENVFIAGFYSKRGTDRMVGTIYQKIDPTGNTVVDTMVEFSSQFLSNYLSSAQISKGKELRNFYLNDLVLRSDGGLLLLAEKFYVTQQSYRDMYGFWVDQNIYHYDDVILTSLSNNGGVEWQSIIDKNQAGLSSGALSYFHAIGGEKVYVIYEYNDMAGMGVYFNAVGVDGYVSKRTPLIREYRPGNEFYPRYCTQISNSEALMIYFQDRGRTLTLAKVTLGE